MVDSLTSAGLWELLKHAAAWLRNLSGASAARKQESRIALQKVVLAVRRTSTYARHLSEQGPPDAKEEARLAVLWTELGFALEPLGLGKLAKRCHIKGRQWADPAQFDEAFLQRADVTLERIEQLASTLLRELDA